MPAGSILMNGFSNASPAARFLSVTLPGIAIILRKKKIEIANSITLAYRIGSMPMIHNYKRSP